MPNEDLFLFIFIFFCQLFFALSLPIKVTSFSFKKLFKPFLLQSAQYLLPGSLNNPFKMLECFSFSALSAVLAYRVDMMKYGYLLLFAGIK